MGWRVVGDLRYACGGTMLRDVATAGVQEWRSKVGSCSAPRSCSCGLVRSRVEIFRTGRAGLGCLELGDGLHSKRDEPRRVRQEQQQGIM